MPILWAARVTFRSENYLKSYGEKDVAGLVFVDAVTKFDRALIGGESQKLSPFLLSSDPDKQIFGTREFLSACLTDSRAVRISK